MSGLLSRRRFIAVVAAAAVSGPARAGGVRDTWRGRALGSDASITVEGPSEVVADALPRAVAALRRAERLWSLHDPGSALSRLNAQGRLEAPDADTLALLSVADRVHALTGGRFDPTIQPLWRALAEGGGSAAVAQARATLGWSRVEVSRDAVRLGPGQALTLNGIAQGAAADLVVAALREAGLTAALVDTGETAGFGGSWRLGLSDPVHGLVATRRLRSGAIATSSPGAMRLGSESHILDPTGAGPLWSTVSVEAETATLADALSTAACLMPAGELRDIAARVPHIRRITLVDPDSNLQSIAGRSFSIRRG